MGLFSFLKRDAAADAAVAKKPAKAAARAAAADDVQQLRVRARRRLIGAAVLVAAGVVGFPLIFETQPRPIPVDLPIDIPRKESAPALAVPTREPLAAAEPASTAAAPVPAVGRAEPASEPRIADKPATPSPDRLADKPTDKPAERAAGKPADKASDKVAEKSADKTAEKAAARPADKPAEKPADKPKAATDGARAQALLEGRDPAAPAAARYIVQVGAYAENKAAQEMRSKVEKLGLKTYAQAVDAADGHRVRVRVGPFGNRDEAERAAAKLKGAGLPGAILTL